MTGSAIEAATHLLCDYTGVEDSTCETMEMFEASEVTKWVTRLVSSRTIVEVWGYGEGVLGKFSA